MPTSSFHRAARAAACLPALLAATIAACTPRGPEPRGTQRSSGASLPMEAGLLVGLAHGRTMLLAAEGDSMRLVGVRDTLVVPDSGGWWFVESRERCTTSEDDGSDGSDGVFVHSTQVLVVARAGDTATVAIDGIDCGAAAQRVTDARARRQRAAVARSRAERRRVNKSADGDPEDEPGLECRIATERVTWLASAAISVEQRDTQSSACHPTGGSTTTGSNVVRRLGTGQPIALRTLLPPAERAAAERAFAGAEGCTFDDDRSPALMDGAWAVRRADGAWVADAWLDGPNACRGMHDIAMRVPLPPPFTGAGPLPVPFAELRARRPGLRDAGASPSGALLALIEGDALMVVRVRGGELEETLVQVPGMTNADFVMLRWANAAEVARWRRELPGLRAPGVRVTAPPAESR